MFLLKLIDRNYNLIAHACQRCAILISLKTGGNFRLVFHNEGDGLSATVCAPEEEFIPEQQREKKREREINGVGEAKGLCGEQMVSRRKHVSTFVPSEPQRGDVYFC